MKQAEDAAKCMEKLAGLDIAGKALKVGPVIDQRANAAGINTGAVGSSHGGSEAAGGSGHHIIIYL